MTQFDDIQVLFVAGFGPIVKDIKKSKAFYADILELPLKALAQNNHYFLTEQDALSGVKHFALWSLSDVAECCFSASEWPQDLPVPQAWIDFEVADLKIATQKLLNKGFHLFIANREEPWGQNVTRLLSPEGLLVGLTITPWLRDLKTAQATQDFE
ncbi:VOC family protein [Acinetobacter larvae]|uniref:Glyoxalase n=1 Tax=Acinetobacter larvae TaxID=1789224 RepID=A0A1B2LZP9_9GAMM|nr:VOC family protein [Acinetobacter larvae]AOA58416.1 glyoxalase [Acinetobacter larvae]